MNAQEILALYATGHRDFSHVSLINQNRFKLFNNNYNKNINSDSATHCEAAEMDANELLRLYSEGQRNFRSQDLQGLSLTKASLSEIDFSGANLSDTDFTNSDLGNANLNWATLKRAKLNNTYLVGAKMPDGRIHNDRMESANFLGL